MLHRHFCSCPSGAERRLILFGFGPESFRPSAPERADDQKESQESGDTKGARKGSSTDRGERQRRETEQNESDVRDAEHRLEDEAAREDLTKLLERHKSIVGEDMWMKAKEADVVRFKEELRSILKLPQKTDFVVRIDDDRGGSTIEVYDRGNPLRMYAVFRQNYNRPVNEVKRDIPVADRIPSDVNSGMRKLLKINDRLGDRATKTNVTTVNSKTSIELIDRETGKVLGVATVDEKTQGLLSRSSDSNAIERIVEPRVNHFEKELLNIPRLARADRELLKRAIVDQMCYALDGDDVKLGEAFRKRPCLITSERDGKKVKLTLIDKKSELVISTQTYNPESQEVDMKLNNLTNIKRALAE